MQEKNSSDVQISLHDTSAKRTWYCSDCSSPHASRSPSNPDPDLNPDQETDQDPDPDLDPDPDRRTDKDKQTQGRGAKANLQTDRQTDRPSPDTQPN